MKNLEDSNFTQSSEEVQILPQKQFREDFPSFSVETEPEEQEGDFTFYKIIDKDGKYHGLKCWEYIQDLNDSQQNDQEEQKDDQNQQDLKKIKQQIYAQKQNIFLSKCLDHQNLLKYNIYEYFEDIEGENTHYLALSSEFFTEGSLYDLTQKDIQKIENMSPPEIITILSEINEALLYLRIQTFSCEQHSFNINTKYKSGMNHLNINLRNILIDKIQEENRYILSDYSLGRLRRQCQGSDTLIDYLPQKYHASVYRSPEFSQLIESPQQNVTKIDLNKCDVYSLGICGLMLACKIFDPEQIIFMNQDLENDKGEQYQQILREVYLEKIKDEDLREVIEQMITFDHEDRKGSVEIKELIDKFIIKK